MSRIVLILFFIIIFFGCTSNKATIEKGSPGMSATGENSGESFFGPPASSINDVYTSDFLSILNNASFVQVSKLKQQNGSNLYFDPLSAEKAAEGKQLSDKEIEQLKNLLTNPSTYRFDIKKKCPFSPEYEIDFISESRSAAIFVSGTCKSLARNEKGAPIIDFDPQAEALLSLIE